MNKKLILLSLLLLSNLAIAQEAKFKVKQVISTSSVVMVENISNEEFPIGKVFLVTFGDGKQCPLVLQGKSVGFLTFDSSKCDQAKNISLGSPVEPSLHSEILVAAPPITEAPKAVMVQGTPERKFTDLGYLLPEGGFGTLATLSYGTTGMKVYSGSTLASESKGRSSRIGITADYGILENLQFSLNARYLINTTTDYDTTGNKYASKGLEDPKLTLQYRAISQAENVPLDLIIGVSYSPKIVANKSATTSDNGNGGQGRDITAVQLALYKRLSRVSLGFNLEYTALGAGESEDATSGDKTLLGTTNITTVSGLAQFRLARIFFLRAGLGFSSYADSEQKEVTTGDISKTSSYVAAAFIGGAKLVVIPETAYLDLDLLFASADDVDASSGGTKVKIKDYRATSASIGFRYEF